MNSWLQKNGAQIYSMHNEGEPVFSERFIRTLKNKIYKYMTSVSTNVYIDKLEDIVNKYNNSYHNTIKMKRAEVKSNPCIDFSNKINEKVPKLKISDNIRSSKYKNIFAKGFTPN